MADLTGMLQAAAGSAGGGEGWDLSTAQFNGSPVNYISVANAGVGTSGSGLYFKSDGTSFYVTDNTGKIHQFDLTVAWDVKSASFIRTASITNVTQGVFFKPDGTKFYVVSSSTDSVVEWSLSTAWNISGATETDSYSVSSQESAPNEVFFKPDGTEMYVMGTSGDDVNQYSLSTAWDISSASYVRNFSISSKETVPTALFFKSDGTKMYVGGPVSNAVHEYSLSTAWNISSASFTSTKSVSPPVSSVASMFFKPDGTKVYCLCSNQIGVFAFDLATAWNISTATFTFPTTNYFSVSAKELACHGLYIKPDGTNAYVIGFASDSVHQYSLSIAWDISSASFVRSFSVSTQETDPKAIFFKPDGTEMYVIGRSGDDVNQYSLSTAWDISSASYVRNFSVASQDTGPEDLYFKPDGTKMYISGSQNSKIYEYDLSTAWDISSSSFLQSFDDIIINAPNALSFKDDGKKLYLISGTTNAIWSYDL